MYTENMVDFRIKQDEMLRQAENHRLIQTAQKAHSPASRAIRTLKNAINFFLSF